MAGQSASQSTGFSQSFSDTYIPEYSETPILQEIATHARAMSDQVYNWGMGVWQRNQGDIDGLMRDALSYASPQRIAVDMGMAEAGVQQAAERGRLSAVRDLEGYGVDPSSGRYEQLNLAERVKGAAAAAGAGNQQRMADQAAGNAMRNQAIAAGLQNANFGLGVGDSANRFLATASSLKYPPLGRYSESMSQNQSTSGSVQTDPGQGGGVKTQPSKQEKPAGGGGGGQKGGGKGGGKGKPEKPAQMKDAKPPGGGKPQAGTPTGGGEGEELPSGMDIEFDPFKDLPNQGESGVEPNEVWTGDPVASGAEPNEAWTGDPVASGAEPGEVWTGDPVASGAEPNEVWGEPAGPAPVSGMDMEFNPLANTPEGGYQPYDGQTLVGDPFGTIDPTAGIPQEGERQTAEADPAGALFSQEAGGGWGGGDYFMPAGYEGPTFGGGDEWSDIGQGAFDSTAPGYDVAQADESLGGNLDPWTQDSGPGAYDYGGYDDFTDYGGYGDVGGYDDFTDYGDQGFGDTSYGDPGDYGYDDFADYGDDFGDYGGDYGDYGDDYGDYSDYGDDYGGYDDFTDYGDAGDYGDDYSDYGDYGDDYTDYGDASDYGDDYTDYSDDYSDSGDYSDYSDSGDYYDSGGGDYEDSGGGGEDYYDSGGGDYGGDSGADEGEYARGGVVRGRGKMNGRRPPPMRTGFRPRPRVPRFQQGGPMPMLGQGAPRPMGRRRMDPPPPGARGAPPGARGAPPMPGNFISPNGMQPPATGGMPAPGPQTMMPRAAPQIQPARPRPQHFAGGGQAGKRAEPTQGGFVSRELSPSAGSQTDDVNARLNAGEFVIPKDVAQWKGKEFFYKMIAQARKLRAGGDEKPKVGYQTGGTFNPMQGAQPMMNYQTPAQIPQMPQRPQRPMTRGMR